MSRFPAFSFRAVVAITASVVALGAVPLAAQRPPLGDVARKEAERRKAQEPAGKVYTSKDLPAPAHVPGDVSPAEPAEPVEPAVTAPVREPAAPAPKTPVRDQAWWKGRLVDAREDLRRNEALAETLQTRINALSRDFVSRDNPVQRARLGEERAEALNELARVREEIERGRMQIADIEEEARRAGVPPGWLR